MTDTKTLFDRPLSRTKDPVTSYEAADKMIESGALNRQEQEVWEVIKLVKWARYHRTFTAKELSNWSVIDYYTIQRRLSGLHHKGKIERTGEKRNGCCVWRIL